MEIIKAGKLPGQRTYTTTCGNCGCRFKFKASEAKFESDQREGDALVVKCPTRKCGEKIWVAVK